MVENCEIIISAVARIYTNLVATISLGKYFICLSFRDNNSSRINCRRRGSFQLTNYGQPRFVEHHYAWATWIRWNSCHSERNFPSNCKNSGEKKKWIVESNGQWHRTCEIYFHSWRILTVTGNVTVIVIRNEPPWTNLEIWMDTSKEQDACTECKSITLPAIRFVIPSPAVLTSFRDFVRHGNYCTNNSK